MSYSAPITYFFPTGIALVCSLTVLMNLDYESENYLSFTSPFFIILSILKKKSRCCFQVLGPWWPMAVHCGFTTLIILAHKKRNNDSFNSTVLKTRWNCPVVSMKLRKPGRRYDMLAMVTSLVRDMTGPRRSWVSEWSTKDTYLWKVSSQFFHALKSYGQSMFSNRALAIRKDE